MSVKHSEHRPVAPVAAGFGAPYARLDRLTKRFDIRGGMSAMP